MRFWDSSYRCFTFGKNDLVPTIEEYSILIDVELQHPDKIYIQKSRTRWQKDLEKILRVKPQVIDTYLVRMENHTSLTWNILQDFIREHLHDEHGTMAFSWGTWVYRDGSGGNI